MTRDSIRLVTAADYLVERIALPIKERSLFDFLFLTGARVSEALMVKAHDFDWEKKKVTLHTLKNPLHPLRPVLLFPNEYTGLLDSVETAARAVINGPVWDFSHRKTPRIYVWELCRQTFGCTTHSFRHTNATIFTIELDARLDELMARYGWKDSKPATIYTKIHSDQSIDRKALDRRERMATRLTEQVNQFVEKGGKL